MRKTAKLAPIILAFSLLLGGCTLPEWAHMEGLELEKLPFFSQETPEPAETPAPSPTARPGAAGEVERFLQALQDDDRDTVRAYCGDSLPGYTRAEPPASRTLNTLYRAIYGSLSYRLGAVAEGGSSATVGVEITVRDMRAVFEALSPALSEQMAGEDFAALSQIQKELARGELLEECLESVDATVTRKINLSLRQENGAWKISVGSETASALTGGLTTALQDFDLPEEPGAASALADEDQELWTYLMSNDVCSFTVTAVRPSAPEGYTLEVQAQNKTWSELVFSLRGCSVNGYLLDPDWTETLSAGESRTVRIVWDRAEMEKCGISSVRNIEFILDVFEKPAWPVYPLVSGGCTVYPHGWDNTADPRVTAEEECVLVDNGTVVFSVLDARSDGCWGYTMTVYLENNTWEELWFSLGDERVNGVALDPGWSQTLPAGKRAVETIRFPAGALMLQGIDQVESVDFRLFISSLDDLDQEEGSYSAGGRFSFPPAG